MTKRALGPGATCCGKDCELCGNPTPAPSAPAPAPEPKVVEDDYVPSDEEEDE